MKVLLVIDMLNDFIRPEGALFCSQAGADMVPYVAGVLHCYRQEEDPVIFLADAHDPDDKEFDRFPCHCVKDSWGAQVIEELYKEGEPIIEKTRYSGFYGTDLEKTLLDLAPDGDLSQLEVELVGVCTNICVLYTAEELRNRDILTRVYKDGVATFDEATQTFTLGQMESVLGVELI